VRPLDYVSVKRPLREVAPDHFVQDWQPEDWPALSNEPRMETVS